MMDIRSTLSQVYVSRGVCACVRTYNLYTSFTGKRASNKAERRIALHRGTTTWDRVYLIMVVVIMSLVVIRVMMMG